MQWEARSEKGFTIVELLIVVVVIAILATITIVAYNGIQDRAKASAAQSAATQAAKKIAAYAVTNSDMYPSDITNPDVGLRNDDRTSYQYWLSSDAKAYCVTATTSNISYYMSNTMSAPATGACNGHGANGQSVITNRLRNPSVENGTTDLSYMGGNGTDSNMNLSTAWADSGAQSYQVAKSVASGAPKGIKMMLPDALVAGDVVRWAATVRNSGTTSGARLFTAFGERNSPSYVGYGAGGTQIAINPGQSTRITGQVTITSSTTAAAFGSGFGILPVGSTPFAVGESYFIDSFVVTVNDDLPSVYVDGSSPRWAWKGSPNNSPSMGPTP